MGSKDLHQIPSNFICGTNETRISFVGSIVDFENWVLFPVYYLPVSPWDIVSVDMQNVPHVCKVIHLCFCHVIPLKSKRVKMHKLNPWQPKKALSIDYQKPTR
jgi:hypothetical protein